MILDDTRTSLLVKEMIHYGIFILGRDVMILGAVVLAFDSDEKASIIGRRRSIATDLFYHECCTFANLRNVESSVIEQLTRLQGKQRRGRNMLES